MTNSNLIEHAVSEDGLILTSTLRTEDGPTYTATVQWHDRATAEEHIAAARIEAEKVLRGKETATMESEPKTSNKWRTVGNFQNLQVLLFTSVGGKPWLLPHPRLQLKGGWLEVGIGWLWGAFYFGFKRTK